MIDVKLPRILGSNKEVHPLSLSVNLDITPLSTASMLLPKDENLPSRGYVELFTPIGSAGIFRVRSPEDAYGDDTTSAQLEHAISEVGDYLVRTEISEMMAATTAMQTIFGHYRGTRWQLGSVSALGSGNVAVDCKYVRVLDAMLSILEQKPSCMLKFNFSTTPWTVSVAERDDSVSAEGRLSRNIRSAKVITDDTELCTRLYYQIPSTDAEGQPIQVWTHMDASTINTYGVVEREFQGGSGYTESEADAAASEYLRKHKRPRVTIEIDAEELSSITGETFDRFTIGKMMRLALPDYNTTATENITGLSWQDVINLPNQMTVRLGDEEDTVVNFLHDVDKNGGTDGSNGGGGGGGRKKNDDEWKEYRTRFEKDDYHLALVSERVDRSDNILQAAGLDINSQTGVIIYHDDVENGVAARLATNANAITAEATQRINADIATSGRLDVEAGKVAMVVGTNAYGNYIKAGEITLAINESGESEAHIDANKVYIGNEKSTTVINGKLEAEDITANFLSSRIADIPVLTARSLSVTGTLSSSGYVYAPEFILGSNSSGASGNKNVSNALSAVQITDGSTAGTKKLQYKRFSDSDWQDAQTFSTATSLSGSWSGSTLTVTASPQNQHYYQYFTTGAREKADGTAWSSISDGQEFYIPVLAYSSQTQPISYTKIDRAYVDVSGIYTAGRNSTSIGLTYVASSSNYKVYVVNHADSYMMVSSTNTTNSSMTRTIAVKIGSTTVKSFTITDYKSGWNDCIDACSEVTRYTRTATGGGGSYGGNNYTHYISYQGTYKDVGTGWYQTSQANAYTIPSKM